MNYTCINIQGNLISEDVLKKIEQGEASGQTASDFGIDSAANLRNEMEYAWSRIKLDWKYFTGKSGNLPATDPYGTTTTRRWMTGFFSALGFDLVPRKSALTGGNDQSYAISHVAGNIDDLPVHIVGFHDPSNPDKNTIDIRSSGGTSRLSPHATVQEYLNVTEHLYGIAANGNLLRLMRDSGRLVKLTYLEFDLRRMLEEDKYSEFTLLFRLLHASRFPRNQQETESCLLERYYNESIESGNRIRDGLSTAVQKSLLALGNGFLRDEANENLREKLRDGQLTPADYYRQLRRLIYRLLFLMVAEERDLVYDPAERNSEILRKKKIYFDYYSISRLRKLSRNRYLFEARYNDIWLGLLRTFTLFSEEARGRHLAIEPLGGDLFDQRAIEDLESCLIGNHLLLECIRDLNEFTDVNGNLVSVNYRSLDVEEFGSVYEGLLDLHPVIEGLTLPGMNMIRFTFHEGTDRKTTASYYTRPDLVNEIMKSAVIPVVEDKLKEAERIANSEWRMANGEGRVANSELRVANSEWKVVIQKYFKNLITNLSLEYVNLSRIAHLAKRDGFSGDDLPIDKLLSQRRIVWDDFSTPSGRLLSSSQYRGGMGAQQQQGIQQLSANSQRKSEGDGNTFAAVSPDRTMHPGADTTYDGLVFDRGQADTLLSKIHLSEKDQVLIWNRLPASIRYSLLAHHHLLNIKVCDPAAGSGHFLLATARTLAWYHARVTSGEENPAPVIFRASLRQVIQHCIYGVDLNPDAVELCKLALWIESHDSGKPLSFLDHKIRCGNSLVGVTDLTILQKGIPDEAFDPVTGDDRTVARTLKRDNSRFRSFLSGRSDTAFQQQLDFGETPVSHKYGTSMREVDQISQDSLDAVHRVRQRFEKMRSDREWFRDWEACNLWTAAFFFTYTPETRMAAPTSEHLHKYLNHPTAVPGPVIGKADGLASKNRFFHWPLEFPEVFDSASGNSGFDVMVGNPPWEKINLEDKEFFETRDKKISDITKSKLRTKAIERLEQLNPDLYKEYHSKLNSTNKSINFFKSNISFKYGNKGLLNTYPLFTELAVKFIKNNGKAGLVIPSGFFADDTISPLFRYCVENNYIDTIFDFENSKKIFPSVHRQTRFSLVTLGKSVRKDKGFNAMFYLTNPFEISKSELGSMLSFNYEILKKFNPNNLVCPSFMSQFEFELNKKLFKFGVLKDVDNLECNIEIHRMINMSSDSDLLINDFFESALPVYESKLFTFYDHRYSDFIAVSQEDKNNGNAIETTNSQKESAYFRISPRYYSDFKIFKEKNKKWNWKHNWYLAYRYISASTNERTAICSIIPASVVSNSSYLILMDKIIDIVLQKTFINTLLFDFVARSKVNLNFPPVIMFQTPRISKKDISIDEQSFIVSRGVELTYTSWDIKDFADDIWKETSNETKAIIRQQWEANKVATGGHNWSPPEWCQIDDDGCPLPPFKWDEERRAVLKAELDAIYARLYDLNSKQLRYILDPADLTPKELEDIRDLWEEVKDPLDPEGYAQRSAQSTFPGETFRVLKDKEIRKFGEYRTRRLVLEAWERIKD